MRTTRPLLVISVALLVSLVSACGGDGGDDDDGVGSGGSGSSYPAVIDGRTFLSTTVTAGGKDRPLAGGTSVSLTFSDGRITASAGCNTMGGDYTIKDDVLLIGQLSTTEMGCDPERDDQDRWLAGVLTGSPAVHLAGTELVLTAGEVVITLLDRDVAEPDTALTGTKWILETIVDGETSSSVPAGVESTFEISEDGTVVVNLGCNSGGGSAEIGDGTLTFAPIGSTEMRCSDPAMQVESSVSAVLTGAVTYEIDASLLTMRNGSVGLDWRAAP